MIKQLLGVTRVLRIVAKSDQNPEGAEVFQGTDPRTGVKWHTKAVWYGSSGFGWDDNDVLAMCLEVISDEGKSEYIPLFSEDDKRSYCHYEPGQERGQRQVFISCGRQMDFWAKGQPTRDYGYARYFCDDIPSWHCQSIEEALDIAHIGRKQWMDAHPYPWHDSNED
jgi:hypothetical protein